MMLREMKENDVNESKWIGVGGKFKVGETAAECLKREVKEETGIELASFLFHSPSASCAAMIAQPCICAK